VAEEDEFLPAAAATDNLASRPFLLAGLSILFFAFRCAVFVASVEACGCCWRVKSDLLLLLRLRLIAAARDVGNTNFAASVFRVCGSGLVVVKGGSVFRLPFVREERKVTSTSVAQNHGVAIFAAARVRYCRCPEKFPPLVGSVPAPFLPGHWVHSLPRLLDKKDYLLQSSLCAVETELTALICSWFVLYRSWRTKPKGLSY
jgi:hypothetical protein